MSKKFMNYIDGKWCDAKSNERFENRNPARWKEIIGTFPRSSKEDINQAVESARVSFKSWSSMPAPARGAILKKVGDLLTKSKDEIASHMTREMGKVLAETKGDVQEAIDTAYYAGTFTRQLFTYTVPSELPSKFATTVRRPVGVAAVITPWNFPLAVPSWKIFPALACGNTVVWKPAGDTPHTANLFVEILLEAGLPAKVIQLVHGHGSEVGGPLVSHPDVNLISFTGSTDVGQSITRQAGIKKISLEMGGKNAIIVTESANLDLVVDGILWGAFGTTGQRCTATSRAIVHESVRDRLLAMLMNEVKKLKVGNGLEKQVQVGPLINESQFKTVQSYVEIGQSEGAHLLVGGKGDRSEGWFFEPTLFSDVKPAMRISQEEIFGPVLSVLTYKSFDEALEIANTSRYGLSSAVYTQNVREAFLAIEKIDSGITYINAPTIGAEAHLPFGGIKDTGNGHREGGWMAYDFFSEIKTIYVDYSGRLQRAQIDNY
ncbi:MAG: aldehyde dehydrogenase family protein [Deltaproteobacteria bacterium]|nr:aldehyde dehydrogenase family protein [Deltaproteobacteria bacterium]